MTDKMHGWQERVKAAEDRAQEESRQDGWRLGLVPKKDSQVHKYLKSIEIEGNPDMITKIIISTVDSGKTSISFKKG